MKDAPIVVVVCAAVVVLGVGAYLVSPALWSPDAVVDAEAVKSVETARRCLIQYDVNQDALNAINQQLSRAGVDLSLQPDQIQQYAEGHAQSTLAEVGERVKNRTSELNSMRRVADKEFEELGGSSQQPSTAFNSYGSNPGSMAQAMNKGRQARDELLKKNQDLLNEALSALSKGIDFEKGDASGRSNLAMNSLKGTILQHQGEMANAAARNLRIEADKHRQALMALADRIETSKGEAEMAGPSKIDDLIKLLKDTIAEQEQKLNDKNAEMKDMEQKVADIRSRLEAAQNQRKQARSKMDALTRQGADLSKPTGAEDFAKEYAEVADQWRRADKLAHSLENGTLDGAVISPDEDYLNSPYLPKDQKIDYQRGLHAWQADLDRAREEARLINERIDSIKRDLAIQKNIRSELLAREEKAQQKAEELTSEMKKVFGDLVELRKQVADLESKAINKLNESTRAFSAASSAARQWRQPGPDFNTLPPEKQEMHPMSLRRNDNWLEGDLEFQTASVRILESMVWYSRYRDALSDLSFYTELGDIVTLPADIKEELTGSRDESLEKGTAAAKKASDSMKSISSKCSGHWTVAALAGDARYMLYLFGNEDALENAIGNYRNAVQDREDSPYTRVYRQRLEELQKAEL